MKEGKEPSPKGGLLAALVSAPSSRAGSGLGANLSEDAEKEGAAEPYGSAPGAMPESKFGDHSFRALARALGIPKERQTGAQAALKQYIKECIAEAESDEPEET